MSLKLLIAFPTYDAHSYCLQEFSAAIKALDLEGIESEIYIVDNSDNVDYANVLKKTFPTAYVSHFEPPKDQQIKKVYRYCELKSREMIRLYMIKGKFDYLFMCDSDTIPPKNTIKQLLSRDKNICSAFCIGRYGPSVWYRIDMPIKFTPSGIWKLHNISDLEINNAKNNNRIIRVSACGFGCLLIGGKVLNFEFRKSKNNWYGADINFCYDAYRRGFSVWGDPTVECEHLHRRIGRHKR